MEFTKSFNTHMEILKKANKFYDYDLRRKVNERMYELSEEANDEQLDMFSAMEDATDDDEFYSCVHALANLLSI